MNPFRKLQRGFVSTIMLEEVTHRHGKGCASDLRGITGGVGEIRHALWGLALSFWGMDALPS